MGCVCVWTWTFISVISQTSHRYSFWWRYILDTQKCILFLHLEFWKVLVQSLNEHKEIPTTEISSRGENPLLCCVNCCFPISFRTGPNKALLSDKPLTVVEDILLGPVTGPHLSPRYCPQWPSKGPLCGNSLSRSFFNLLSRFLPAKVWLFRQPRYVTWL